MMGEPNRAPIRLDGASLAGIKAQEVALQKESLVCVKTVIVLLHRSLVLELARTAQLAGWLLPAYLLADLAAALKAYSDGEQLRWLLPK
jgi:hypothetical protein